MKEKPNDINMLSIKPLRPASAASDTTARYIPTSLSWTRLLLCLASIFLTWLSLLYTKIGRTGAGELEMKTNGPYDSEYPSLGINITYIYNNKAAGPGAAFDPHSHGAYPTEYLPVESFKWDRIKFNLPGNWSANTDDNVIAQSQRIELEGGSMLSREFHVLYAGDWIDDIPLVNGDPIGLPLSSITLPKSTWPNHLHVFALSVVPCILQARSLMSVRRAVFTTQWEIIKGFKAYAVEVTVVNPLPSAVASDRDTWHQGLGIVGVVGSNIRTVRHGTLYRIIPSDEIRVKVWVVPTYKTPAFGIDGSFEVVLHDEDGALVETHGRTVFEYSGAFAASSSERTTPEWWEDAKFGIFIHWGIYSVPGWAPGELGWYGEWYNWWLHKWPQPWNGYWKHHLDTYGSGVVYDDFIANFTGSDFNASAWVNLFADAGAKYFVLTTKHHDGFALFDTKGTTHRSSYHLGPRRDFLRELFEAAKAETPQLKRGTYITMPEWFNPDAGRGGYGFGDFPGTLAHNAYNDTMLELYTGRLRNKDYLRDIQLAHMKMLAYDYETEIIWCDIGGPNLTKEFAQDWYPFAESQGRQVVMNNRCGDLPQFDTPELELFSSIQSTKWETSESIDPYSYGYNRATTNDQYKNATTILHRLIDIVSKNGNYLLNVGPSGTGLIIPPMISRLLEVGRWLEHSGSCIYGTKYFFLGAEYGTLRFTQTAETFCIISLSRPENRTLEVDTLVPVTNGDKISLLGGGAAGLDLPFRYQGKKLIIDAPEEAFKEVQHAWVFRVAYNVKHPS
ncbi:hypothetical protein FRB96_003968 [Tulasnella sp. 330]|nr:hypothetical protein FRB96_003968 [Tulasnella sp. 330]